MVWHGTHFHTICWINSTMMRSLHFQKRRLIWFFSVCVRSLFKLMCIRSMWHLVTKILYAYFQWVQLQYVQVVKFVASNTLLRGYFNISNSICMCFEIFKLFRVAFCSLNLCCYFAKGKYIKMKLENKKRHPNIFFQLSCCIYVVFFLSYLQLSHAKRK